MTETSWQLIAPDKAAPSSDLEDGQRDRDAGRGETGFDLFSKVSRGNNIVLAIAEYILTLLV